MKCYDDLWSGAGNFHNIVIYLSLSAACLAHLLGNSYIKCFITGFIFASLPFLSDSYHDELGSNISF